MIAQEVSSWNTAMEMIMAGLRPPTVHAATGLCKNRLRNLYRAVHGRSALQGRISEHAYNRLKTKKQVLEGTTFYQVYHRLGGDRIFRAALDPRLIINVYRAYRTTFPNCCIDITTAWTIAQDLRENVLKPRCCPECGREYLYDSRSELMSRCPLCHG